MKRQKRRSGSSSGSRPRFHPIGFLPQLGALIDGYVSDANELWDSLEPARENPHVLDSHTLERIHGSTLEALEFFDYFEQQLARWTALELTAAQKEEVKRLQGQVTAYRATGVRLVDAAAELRGKTIEALLEMEDAEVGLRSLAGELPPPPGEKRRGSTPPPFSMPPEVESRLCQDLTTGDSFYEFHHRRLGRLGRIVVMEGPEGNSILRAEHSHEPRHNLEERKAFFGPLATALMEQVARLQQAGRRAPG